MKKKLIPALLIIVASYIIGIGIAIAADQTVLNNIGALLGGALPLSVLALGVILALVYIVSSKEKSGASSARVGKTKEGNEMSQYYDAKFVTEEELLHEKRLLPNTWETLPLCKRPGWVVRTTTKGSKLLVNMFDSDVHCMIIGTTGSGKTSLIIDQTIRVFAHTEEKPCLVITDPKGELYDRHSITLKEEGYRVMVLDLRNPFASTRWNPMDNAYVQYHRSQHLDDEVKIYRDADPKQTKLKLVEGESYGSEWYEFDGVAYPNRQLLESDLLAKSKLLKDEAENELREIASTIVTIESQNDQSWERGAQDFLYGIMIAMLEDSLKPELGMTRERFNFYNLGKIATYRDNDPDNMFGTLRKYCDGRDRFSPVNSLTSTVINNAPNTARSYMGVLQGKIGFMQDQGICYATSLNEMHFDDFVEKPTVFFIKVPDEKESRHCIATMCISQLYKKLIEYASKCKGQQLPRTTYFLLDEFANLPKIPNMSSLITVARSRRIFFEIVVQSYSQLDNKYGKEAADTIRTNCNIQIYLGTEDAKTKEEYSKMCGEVSLEIKDVSESKSEGKKETGGNSSSKTTSAKVVTRPLIGPYELGQLPFGSSIVKIFRMNPIKAELTPFRNIPMMAKKEASETYVPTKFLNEEEVMYDIKARNKKVLRSSGGFDDFDF